jgi:indolepyruvate ferredoxin oxidoreductase alpha subunit
MTGCVRRTWVKPWLSRGKWGNFGEAKTDLKQLLSGNEAMALGAYWAGVKVAAAYPGTPSTEILESLARYTGPYVEWSTNEKVALEVALGASYGGVRAMAVMKHVGLNVAADPFFAAAITGVGGGLVVISCDDPGMHSSQDEQDNRHYARFARVPMLEPTDSEEAYKLMSWAFQMSEEFDTPVLFRSTTRISHCASVVDVAEKHAIPESRPVFQRTPEKYVMVPSHARVRRRFTDERLRRLAAWVENFPLNEMMLGDRKLGIVASGVAYQYAREVFREASFLKLVTTYPLPVELVRQFADEVEKILVIEELDPFLEGQFRELGLFVLGKEVFPQSGELNPEIVARSAAQAGLLPPRRTKSAPEETAPLPARPPLLCAGCPHRGAEYTLTRLNLKGARPGSVREPIVTGDIGCYTLGVYPPLQALDTCACMGASIGQALGLEKAGVSERVVAVLGDSTFMHSGVTGLIDVVYNQGKTLVVILDNETTAMTGHQGHPGTGLSARGKKGHRVNLEKLVCGIGLTSVQVVSSFDLKAIEAAFQQGLAREEASVVIVRGNCPLHVRPTAGPFRVDQNKCSGCQTCLELGCPALYPAGDVIDINQGLCTGAACGLCRQICPQEAVG